MSLENLEFDKKFGESWWRPTLSVRLVTTVIHSSFTCARHRYL